MHLVVFDGVLTEDDCSSGQTFSSADATSQTGCPKKTCGKCENNYFTLTIYGAGSSAVWNVRIFGETYAIHGVSSEALADLTAGTTTVKTSIIANVGTGGCFDKSYAEWNLYENEKYIGCYNHDGSNGCSKASSVDQGVDGATCSDVYNLSGASWSINFKAGARYKIIPTDLDKVLDVNS